MRIFDTDCVKFNDVFAYLKLIARWHRRNPKVCNSKQWLKRKRIYPSNEWDTHTHTSTQTIANSLHWWTKYILFTCIQIATYVCCTLFISLSFFYLEYFFFDHRKRVETFKFIKWNYASLQNRNNISIQFNFSNGSGYAFAYFLLVFNWLRNYFV